ncbi:Saccharopine dehydrogenase NADP binding domain protein [Sporomusa termitida]|uniref:Saccharopine dehydrogenase NADP binding domain protein n=1 Tax=Sporomusa termitida TaxID=2377 RepID=A0A517DV63_9FIRM|nr:Saccharopine dehydrogenase NADP binding domain protein [Sporomusa termitida]
MTIKMAKHKVLVYGATGYTGKLICLRLKELNINFAIAGRDKAKVAELSSQLNVPNFVFATSDFGGWQEALSGCACLINAAGPFALTAENAMHACLQNKIHYLDISAEIPTYQLAAALDQQAKEAGIMIISGAGLFVAYDALVVHTAKRVKCAQQLFVAFSHYGGFSQGSIKSAKYIEELGLLIRENGELQQITDANPKAFDFGEGPQECFPTSLGGTILSYKSTAIPNIREYFQVQLSALTTNPTDIKNLPEGPTAEERAAGRNKLAVEVIGSSGDSAYSIADLPSGYTLTPLSVVAVTCRIVNGDFKAGYQTSGSAYGENIISDIPNSRIIDC